MIKFNGVNCWSPLPPLAYSLKLPSGRYAGIAGNLVGRIEGGKSWLASGGNPELIDSAVAEWNLMWLTNPEVDDLPDLVQAGNLVGINKITYDGEDARLEYNNAVMIFAHTWHMTLLKTPREFLAKTKAARVQFPSRIPMGQVMERAEEVQQIATSNILQFPRKTG